MKKLHILLIAATIGVVFSCQKQENKASSFNGVWSDCNGLDFNNCFAVFSQIGDSIHMGHYIEFKKQPFFETGAGIVKGDSIIYHVDVIKPIPSWGPDGGTHYLKLSDDKNTLEGVFITDSGHKGPLIFKRR